MQCLSSSIKCPAGTYADYDQNECVDCSEGCSLCYGKTICLECEVLSGYRLAGSNCVLCEYPCLTCLHIKAKAIKACTSCEGELNLFYFNCLE